MNGNAIWLALIPIVGLIVKWYLDYRTMKQTWARHDVLAAERHEKLATELSKVHGLVDGVVTAGMESNLKAVKENLLAAQSTAGRKPSQKTLAAIDAMQNDIDTMTADLMERLKQVIEAEKQTQTEET